MNKQKDKPAPKLFFIGTNGNDGQETSENVLQALAYIPAPDGTKILAYRPGVEYPPMKRYHAIMDDVIGRKSKMNIVDLFMEDEEKLRDLETEALREFVEME